jgi:hypothetical protein
MKDFVLKIICVTIPRCAVLIIALYAVMSLFVGIPIIFDNHPILGKVALISLIIAFASIDNAKDVFNYFSDFFKGDE